LGGLHPPTQRCLAVVAVIAVLAIASLVAMDRERELRERTRAVYRRVWADMRSWARMTDAERIKRIEQELKAQRSAMRKELGVMARKSVGGLLGIPGIFGVFD